ncbi:unnamed protein product [Litomosoides sigmodontis]|uniref:Uncharacterized protein n=1 Tax=Litomosoides sigmodontis TaxID=42156 RepID=A0A3P7K7Q1_LITSI|nr:unnamed protein product [Litomosoides sigmodontis]
MVSNVWEAMNQQRRQKLPKSSSSSSAPPSPPSPSSPPRPLKSASAPFVLPKMALFLTANLFATIACDDDDR